MRGRWLARKEAANVVSADRLDEMIACVTQLPLDDYFLEISKVELDVSTILLE